MCCGKKRKALKSNNETVNAVASSSVKSSSNVKKGKVIKWQKKPR